MKWFVMTGFLFALCVNTAHAGLAQCDPTFTNIHGEILHVISGLPQHQGRPRSEWVCRIGKMSGIPAAHCPSGKVRAEPVKERYQTVKKYRRDFGVPRSVPAYHFVCLVQRGRGWVDGPNNRP